MTDASGTGFAVLSTTVADAADARRIARALVEKRLAACVQIVPVRSVYRWQGAVEDADEHSLNCKIALADFAVVAAEIQALHAYDVPEIVAVPIVAASPAYLAWLGESLRR